MLYIQMTPRINWFRENKASVRCTVTLVLYSEEATVPDRATEDSLDNNVKRSSASGSKSTVAQRAKRTWKERKNNKDVRAQ